MSNSDRVESLLDSALHTGDRARMSCPFCEDAGHRDRKRSLSVSTSTGFWRCFRCDLKGKIGALDAGVDYSDRGPVVAALDEFYDKPDEFYRLALDTSVALRPARRYLLGKGRHGRPTPVPRSVWAQADLHACAEGFWQGRIIVPFYAPGKREWLGWVARLWTHEIAPGADGLAAIKYLYPRGMDKGEYLYNQRVLDLDTEDPVILVEGAFDCFAFWNDACAMLGDCSNQQLRTLISCDRPVCVVLDGDAWEKGYMLAARLRFEGQNAGHVRLPARVDPDEVDKTWLLEEARRSIHAVL